MDKHANAALHSLHILVVDDAPVVREPVAAYLRIEGYTVETAANGREGLEKFRTGQFNVVVTDRKMPEMNGDQLAAAIKQIAPNTPVIMMTGSPPRENSAGVDAIVNKPCTPTDLREALAKVTS